MWSSSWCAALNCAPISWWDCSVFESTLAEVYDSMFPAPSQPPMPPFLPPAPPGLPAPPAGLGE